VAFAAQTTKNLALQSFCPGSHTRPSLHAKICYALPAAPPCRFFVVSPEAYLLTKRLHVNFRLWAIAVKFHPCSPPDHQRNTLKRLRNAIKRVSKTPQKASKKNCHEQKALIFVSP